MTVPLPLPAASVHQNFTIARCIDASEKRYQQARARKLNDFAARREANVAFREAMLPLDGADNIRDFVACVAHAILAGILNGNDSTCLLYAAQVAGTTAKRAAQSATGH